MDLGRFGWVFVVLGGFGWLWVVLASFGWFWVVPYVLVTTAKHENHENHMRMTVKVTSYFHTSSFAQRLVLPQGQK